MPRSTSTQLTLTSCAVATIALAGLDVATHWQRAEEAAITVAIVCTSATAGALHERFWGSAKLVADRDVTIREGRKRFDQIAAIIKWGYDPDEPVHSRWRKSQTLLYLASWGREGQDYGLRYERDPSEHY